MIIDCGSCAVAGLACDDCVVSVLLGTPGAAAADAADRNAPGAGWAMTDMADMSGMPVTHVEDEHAAALDVLAQSGLVPPLRLVPRSPAG
jgi:hypothetical protein